MIAALYHLIALALLWTASLGRLDDERATQAVAIALVVHDDRAFFVGDDEKERTLAVHVAVAHREGSGRTSAIGDGGTSFCAFQINDKSGGTIELTRDPHACAAKAHAMLKASLHACPAHPIAWYAEGPRGCDSARAQRISADRMALARRLSGLQ